MEAYNGNKPYIYVSYTKEDNKTVKETVEKLESNGYRIWCDNGNEPGIKGYDLINQKIEDCKAVLAFVSNYASQSDKCRHEIAYALKLKKPFVWIQLSYVELSGSLKTLLSPQQCIIRYKYTSIRDFYNKIMSINKFDCCNQNNDELYNTLDKNKEEYVTYDTCTLTYPAQEICEYIASRWTIDNLLAYWLILEKLFKIRLEEKETSSIEFDKNYSDTIEIYAEKEIDSFMSQIYDSCFNDGTYTKSIENAQWNRYVQNLTQYVHRDLNSNMNNLVDQKETVEKYFNEIQAMEYNPSLFKKQEADILQVFVDTYHELVAYKEMIDKSYENYANILAENLFIYEGRSNFISKNNVASLKTYISNYKGNLLHPIAIRYLLYKMLESLSIQKQKNDQELKTLTAFFTSFELKTFDDPRTKEIEGPEDLTSRKFSIKDRITNKLAEDQEYLMSRYQSYLTNAEKYSACVVLDIVYDKALKYLSNINHSFEMLFNEFSKSIDDLNNYINEFQDKYCNGSESIRYICTSRSCLDVLVEEVSSKYNKFEMSNSVVKEMLSKVYDYSILKSKDGKEDYFKEFIEQKIIPYFKDQAMNQCNHMIDMDILEAIMKEGTIENGYYQSYDQESYIRKVIIAARDHCPLEYRTSNTVQACLYSNQLDLYDNSFKSVIIEQELKNYGGKEDQSVPVNTIIFQHAIPNK